jgi:hypothetical protein
MGSATCEAGGRIEDTLRSADAAMYVDKRRHHDASAAALAEADE